MIQRRLKQGFVLWKGIQQYKRFETNFLAQDQRRCRRIDSEMQATSEAEKNEKVCSVNFIASPLKLR